MGSVSFCGMTAGGRQLSKAVRLIAQREIPAYAGMTRSRGTSGRYRQEIPVYRDLCITSCRGMGMEPGARKMNGGTMGRASQNNHSA